VTVSVDDEESSKTNAPEDIENIIDKKALHSQLLAGIEYPENPNQP